MKKEIEYTEAPDEINEMMDRAIRIPNTPVRYNVVYLKHSILSDVEKIEETITHWELVELLNNGNISLLSALSA